MRTDKQIINIIFDAGKGAQAVPGREMVSGDRVGSLPVPIRFGYSFEGWYLGEELVHSETVVQSEEDIRLIARWSKKTGEKRSSVIKKQKTAICVLSAVVVVLIVALIFVNNLISVTKITDVYFDKDTGERLTQEYRIKKVDGVYGMYDEDGVRMATNADGYHIAMSGNQYYIDQKTGECKLYALVDSFDASVGELLGFGARVMMFPQIEQKNIFSIEVKNKDDSYTVLRYPNGVAYLKGTENKLNLLDDQAFANLSVTCGYTLTTEKLDFSSADTPRLPDGSIDYSAYGLSEADAPVQYTITKRTEVDGKTYAATGAGSSYTVLIGNRILSGGGYYAKLVGRDAVYILDNTAANTVLKTSEVMLTPTALYPMSVNSYLMVYDFVLEGALTGYSNAYQFIKGNAELSGTTSIVDFSFSDLIYRENSMYSLYPFTTNREMMEGYFLDNESISDALESIYMMQISSCLKTGITEESIKEYIFNNQDTANVHRISFRYNVVAREPILVKLDNESEVAFNGRLLDKCKELLKKYGVSAEKVDNIGIDEALETLKTMGICLEDGILYDKSTLLNNVYSYCAGMLEDLGYPPEFEELSKAPTLEELQSKVDAITKQLELAEAGLYYDKHTCEIYVINDVLISEKIDGKYRIAVSLYDMIVEVDSYHLDFLDWNTKEWYSKNFTWMQLSYMSDLEIVSANGTVYSFRLDNSASTGGSKEMKIYYRVNYEPETELKYTIEKPKGPYDTTTETIDALTNFREFYEVLMYISLEGTIDQKELNLMAQQIGADGQPMTPDRYQNLSDSQCSAIIYFRAVDARGNSVAKVMRFYNYSETGHTFLTIDVVDAFVVDEGGNKQATTDWRAQSQPTDGAGKFYVKTDYLNDILGAAEDVINGTFIESVDQNG